MKRLILTLCTLIHLSSYAQEMIPYEGIGATLVAGNGHQFETLEDFDYLPAFYPDADDVLPEDGYSYMWHTDEGHVSHAEKPIFYFASDGPHDVYLTLIPRKKEDDDLKIFMHLNYIVDASATSLASNGDLSEVDMYLDGQARKGDKIYVVVPLDPCQKTGTHNYRVGYDQTKLVYLNVLSQSNLTVTDNPLYEDMAMGMDLNRTVDFSYVWGASRNDVAAVMEFQVLDFEGEESVSLKFHKDKKARCDNDVEIEFSLIRGPYDPNYKESDILEVNVFDKPDKKVDTTEVIYTIHFQNIGDAPVDSITIFDTLPNYLTFISFEGSSEPSSIVTEGHVGGVLGWVIAPDADIKGTNQSPVQPEPNTRGWVSFKAAISEEQYILYDTCYCLTNIATIYFDSLAPITTEADIITIGDALCFSPDPNNQGQLYAQTICNPGIGGSTSTSSSRPNGFNEGEAAIEKEEQLFIAYPNPSDKAFQLKGELEKIRGIEVLNALGQKVLSLSSYETSISIADQPVGLYFIRIIIDEGQQVIRIEKY